MQFHPTVLVVEGTSHLISEAVRGEGAYLRNHAGERFMLRYGPRAELEPRDVVARAILSEMLSEGTNCQYLDLRHLPAEKMYARFPTISAICRKYGLDLALDLLPVAPAAHYCMGGVMVDTYGRTTLSGLYAVGEVACTGVHGANRLASNSLLEGLVFGLRLADGLHDGHIQQDILPLSTKDTFVLPENLGDVRAIPCGGLAQASSLAHFRREIRTIMWQYVSLCRNEEGLFEANRRVHALKNAFPPATSVEQDEEASKVQWSETRNMLLMAELVIIAALRRRESRGSHWRSDYESFDVSLTGRHFGYVQGVAVITTASPGQEVIAHA